MSDMVETAKAPSDDKETAPAPTEEASAKAAGPGTHEIDDDSSKLLKTLQSGFNI